jgi:uncharacterized membrane protein
VQHQSSYYEGRTGGNHQKRASRGFRGGSSRVIACFTMRIALISSFFNVINTYSIWVALGSFSSYLFFSKIYQTHPNYLIACGLAIGVWFFYTLDHLLDAMQLKDYASTVRHKTHYTHQKTIKFILVFVAFILAILAWYLPNDYYNFCALLAGFTAVHFFINYLTPDAFKRKFFLKEVFIALVITIGFVITPYLEVPFKKGFIDVSFLFGLFYFINLSNLMLFSYFDKEEDERAQTMSIARIYSDGTLKVFIFTSLILGLILAAISWYRSEITGIHFLLFISMIGTLGVIAAFPTYFKINDRYRFWGDFIYVYPLLVLPYL